MAGIYKLAITKTEADLKQWLRTQKTAADKERIQRLYRLKSAQASTVESAAALLGRPRVTVQQWLRRDRRGGLAVLLGHKPRTGRQQSLPQWAQEALSQRLHQPEGFESDGEIWQWLETQLGLSAPSKTVPQLVRYRLQASPQGARPMSVAAAEGRVEAAKKTR